MRPYITTIPNGKQKHKTAGKTAKNKTAGKTATAGQTANRNADAQAAATVTSHVIADLQRKVELLSKKDEKMTPFKLDDDYLEKRKKEFDNLPTYDEKQFDVEIDKMMRMSKDPVLLKSFINSEVKKIVSDVKTAAVDKIILAPSTPMLEPPKELVAKWYNEACEAHAKDPGLKGEKHGLDRHPQLKSYRLFVRGARAGGKGLPAIKLNMVTSNNVAVSTAATAQAPVVSVLPGGSTEFASVAALYDEFRAEDFMLKFAVYQVANGTSTLTAGGVFVAYAVAYDPVDATAFGSLALVLTARSHVGPFALSGLGAQATLQVNGHGYDTLRTTLLKGPQVTSSAVDNFPGIWVDTTLATATFGYAKAYITAPGAALQTSYSTISYAMTHFQSRS